MMKQCHKKERKKKQVEVLFFQAEVCENSLGEVLQCVLAGADGCILSFGQTNVGK